MNILNITINITKGNDLLTVIQRKITSIQIAIFLGIPINELLLIELYKMYV